MKISIKRESAYTDSLRKYKVELDGVLIGEIANGANETFPIKPGVHTLRLKIDWARSNEVEFRTTTKSKTAHFRCVSSLKGARAWLAFIYIFLPHKYIKLERID
jgi:hypothetical protein